LFGKEASIGQLAADDSLTQDSGDHLGKPWLTQLWFRIAHGLSNLLDSERFRNAGPETLRAQPNFYPEHR